MSFETGYIKIEKSMLVDLVKAAYDLSKPVGMGFLHFRPEPLTDEQASSYIEDNGTVRLDYVNGRSVKMTVFIDKNTKTLYISDSWYDHSDDDLLNLLDRIGL